MAIQFRRDTAANWASNNPTPEDGQPCFETDTNILKIGDGSTAYNSLPAISGGSGLSDGDYGDVTVSSSGTVITIDNDVVTYAKVQNVSATDRLLGRVSASAGNIEEIVCTDFVQSLLDDADAGTFRTTLGLGTLATQSGTFSGSSSGTNTGDQTTIVGITGTISEFNTALTDGNFTTGGGTCSGTCTNTNSGDQTSIVGITGTLAQFNTAITDGNIIPEAGGTFTGDIIVPDEAYDATAWNASLEVPTKNAVRDKIEDILDGVTFTGDIVVPDEAYGVGWNGSLEVPTKNAVYDKIETVTGGGLSIGAAISGGAANRVLFQDGSQNLAVDADLTFDGTFLLINSDSTGQMRIGAIPSFSTYSAIWLGQSSPSSLNFSFGGSGDAGNSTIMNAPSGGTLRFRVNNDDKATMDSSGNLTLDGYVSAVGSIYCDMSNDALISSADGFPGIWFGSAAAAPSTSNYSFLYEYSLGRTIIGGTNGVEFRVSNAHTDEVWFDSNNRLGVGVAGASDTIPSKLWVKSTTEQLRIAYDNSNYFNATVGSTGSVTFDGVGSGAKFVFNDDLFVESATTRTWGIQNLAAGHTAYFQYGGDQHNRIEVTYDSFAGFKAYHGVKFFCNAGEVARFGTSSSSVNTTFAGTVTVPDDAYSAGWNGSLEVPTKNALYDKIETLTGGGVTEALAIAYAIALG